MDPVTRLDAARRDPAQVVLEGAHALKHALRFGGDVRVTWTADRHALLTLLGELASDVVARVRDLATEVDAATWARLAPRGLPSPALSIAARPAVDVPDLLTGPAAAPVVLLEDPRHLGNVGAVVRVAAAAGAAGVLVTGTVDPWAPGAVRGGAGLQFAVSTARIDDLPVTDRPLVALDPAGEPLGTGSLPGRAVLAFGTERRGLSPALLARADRRLAIPMRPGVSSLNLATAVAVVLYGTGRGTARE